MVKIRKGLAFLSAISLGSSAQAYTYNANHTTTVTGLTTYVDSTLIVFTVADLPPGSCTGPFLVIHPTVPAEQRQMIFASLALAYSSKEPVVIGYDNAACYNGSWIWVARVG